MTDLKKAAHGFVAIIDREELVIRMVEALTLTKRPRGCTAKEALEQAKLYPEILKDARRAARVAIAYFSECIEKGGKPS